MAHRAGRGVECHWLEGPVRAAHVAASISQLPPPPLRGRQAELGARAPSAARRGVRSVAPVAGHRLPNPPHKGEGVRSISVEALLSPSRPPSLSRDIPPPCGASRRRRSRHGAPPPAVIPAQAGTQLSSRSMLGLHKCQRQWHQPPPSLSRPSLPPEGRDKRVGVHRWATAPPPPLPPPLRGEGNATPVAR
jgi:hypothetical protein